MPQVAALETSNREREREGEGEGGKEGRREGGREREYMSIMHYTFVYTCTYTHSIRTCTCTCKLHGSYRVHKPYVGEINFETQAFIATCTSGTYIVLAK